MPALRRPDSSTRFQRRQFVQLFTARVATDPLLGPLFAPPGTSSSRISPAAHEWWERALTGRCYFGRPRRRDDAPGLAPPQLTRWRQLLTTTLHELFRAPQAAEMQARLLNSAASLAHQQLMRPGPPLRSRPPGAALAA